MDQSITNLIREIADGAKRAGVTFEHERNGRKHQVYRLGKSVTIIIPNSTIKPPVRHDIIRQCVPELGERWWDTTNKKTSTNGDNMAHSTNGSTVPEEWKPVHGLVDLYEVSNAGRVRNAVTKRLLALKGNKESPMARMTDNKGRLHEKNVAHMTRTTFGHSPLKNVRLDLDPDRDRKERAKVRELRNPISHMIPDEKVEEIKARVTEPEETMTVSQESVEMMADAAEAAMTKTHTDPDGVPVETDWRVLRIKGVKPIYQISERGEIMGPRGPLMPQEHPQHKHVNVNLMRVASSPYHGAYSPRLDMLVCEVFKGRRPSEEHGPKHLDGDWRNCAADNLEWAVGYAPKEAPKAPHRRRRTRDEIRDDKKNQLELDLQARADAVAAVQETDQVDRQTDWVPRTPMSDVVANDMADALETDRQTEHLHLEPVAPRSSSWEVTKTTTTVYRCRGVEVTVADGTYDIPAMQQASSEQFMALAKIVEQIEIDSK